MLYSDMKGPVTIPTPWSSGRLIETVHPVRDNYKFKETISFPGAKHLYLKFDPRSSSQYDYDKVLTHDLVVVVVVIMLLLLLLLLLLGTSICW